MISYLCEADIENIEWRSLGNHPFGHEADWRTARDILRMMESFPPKEKDSRVRSLWFCVKRGEPDDWLTLDEYRDYAEFYDEPAEMVNTRRLEEWQQCFPDETYWHEATSNAEDDWMILIIDNRVVIEVAKGKEDVWDDPRIHKTLKKMRASIGLVLEKACREDYEEYLSKELPMRCRHGFIKRSDYWEICGKDNCYDDAKMGDEEARTLAAELKRQQAKESIPRIPSLCARDYFRILKDAYIAAGYHNDSEGLWSAVPPEDGRAWYERFGDARDEVIFTMDQGSPEAFSELYSGDHFFNHTFEILAGSSISRVYLYPRPDEAGWLLSLFGSITWHSADMARIWHHLNKTETPAYLSDANDVARALLGEDELFIVPFNESIWHQGKSHFGREVISCIHLPEENAEAVIAQAEWMKVPAPKPLLAEVVLDNDEASILMSALNIYSRIWVGQYDHIEWELRNLTLAFSEFNLKENARKKAWLLMRKLILPELSDMPLEASHGIWSEHTDDRGQTAYDILQVVRHARAWHKNTEGGIERDFDRPWIHGSLPPIQCSCEGEGDGLLMTIALTPAHAALMADAASVMSSIVQQDLFEAMSHYTMSEEALDIAKSIEELLPSPQKGEGGVSPTIESLLCKLGEIIAQSNHAKDAS
ncbi:hypothetical protein [Adlercreutzia sp. ZJ473]|uniref:hypothetical protein n=1 Tax=Adlercreutzia sp. ZJ473 TaxID=2722822 RepID=UPI0015576C61|nr:hypothetical protein [Adlercreutzia sp. ZJ473]